MPLNVGREILQKSRTLKIIRKRVVRKVLDTIDVAKLRFYNALSFSIIDKLTS